MSEIFSGTTSLIELLLGRNVPKIHIDVFMGNKWTLRNVLNKERKKLTRVKSPSGDRPIVVDLKSR